MQDVVKHDRYGEQYCLIEEFVYQNQSVRHQVTMLCWASDVSVCVGKYGIAVAIRTENGRTVKFIHAQISEIALGEMIPTECECRFADITSKVTITTPEGVAIVEFGPYGISASIRDQFGCPIIFTSATHAEIDSRWDDPDAEIYI